MTNQTKILICDDDKRICELISEYLSEYFFEVTSVQHGEGLLAALQQQWFDLILLDLMMPGIDGLTLCRKIRESSDTPIIMITAVDSDIERVAALELGADYYMTKPLNMRVMMAYIKSILRRRSGIEIRINKSILKFSDWQLDTNIRQLISPEQITVDLSAAEYKVLLVLLNHPGCVLSRDQLLEHACNRQHEPFDRSIDVLISRLRNKIEDNAKSPKLIKTIRNGGYLLNAKVTAYEDSKI